MLELKKAHFHTPGIVQMEEQAKAFKDAEHNGLPLDHASKFYLYRATKGEATWDVGLVLRSDHEPNTVKMKNLIGADSLDLVPLEEAERRAGTKSGFIGPVEFDVPMYADKSLEGAYNLTCGANKEGYHHFGFKPDRDLKHVQGIPRSAAWRRKAMPARGAGRAPSRRSAASKWGRSSSSARSTRWR